MQAPHSPRDLPGKFITDLLITLRAHIASRQLVPVWLLNSYSLTHYTTEKPRTGQWAPPASTCPPAFEGFNHRL